MLLWIIYKEHWKMEFLHLSKFYSMVSNYKVEVQLNHIYLIKYHNMPVL